MGTRSFIITTNPKGDCTGIYCHWDGYPKGVGKTLRDHYKTRAVVRNLIRLGDLSSLGERITPLNPLTHSYDHAEEGTTVAYWRDRYAHGLHYVGQPGWDAVKARTGTLSELVTAAAYAGCEYVYLFFNDVWHVLPTDEAMENKPYATVDAALASEGADA